MTQKMVHNISPSKDASVHQIGDSYLKEYRKYAPDLMPILEIRSEVKVTVTQTWNRALLHPKMHSHTEFEIPTSNNIRDMFRTWLFLKLGQRSSLMSQWPVNSTWHSNIPRCIHTKFRIPISTNTRISSYAQNMIILKTRSEVKVTVTRKWYVTLRHPKMHLQTKFGIPTSKNIGDIHRQNAKLRN